MTDNPDPPCYTRPWKELPMHRLAALLTAAALTAGTVTAVTPAPAEATKADLISHHRHQAWGMSAYDKDLFGLYNSLWARAHGRIYYKAVRHRDKDMNPWVRATRMTIHTNRWGTDETCKWRLGGVDPFAHDPNEGYKVTLYMWNPVTGANHHKSKFVPCTHSTKASATMKLGHFPRFHTIGGVKIRWKVRVLFERRTGDKDKTRSGKLRMPTGWEDLG